MKKSPSYYRSFTSLVALASVASLQTSCGSKSSKDNPVTAVESAANDPAAAATTSNSATTLFNSLAAAIPGNLNLSAFSTSVATSSLALDEDSLALADDASKLAGDSPAAELKERAAILKGTADSCLAPGFKKPPTPPSDELCYEFDSDMMRLTAGSGANVKNVGSKDGKNSNGEACLVAFARSQLILIKDPLDRAQNLLNAALCQASKDEKQKAKDAGQDESKVSLIPADVGSSIDLAAYLKNALSKGGRTKDVVNSITMKRLDDVGGQKLYQTVFKVTDDQGNTRVFTLNHSPKDQNNEEYNGTLYFGVKPPKGKADPLAGANGSVDFTEFVSISYQRVKNADGKFTMSYETRKAHFSNDIDPITSTGLVDYNAKADFTGATTAVTYGNYKKSDGTFYAQNNQAGNGFAYITVANIEDKDGKTTDQKLGYWMNPGSNYRENARGMVFSASLNAATNTMEGCANSGSASVDMASGISIRRTVKEGAADANISLTPRGMYHPFANLDDLQGNSAQVTSTGTGDYKYAKTSPTLAIKWGALKATGTDATTFVEKQVSALVTSQCFKQNATSGLWEIDATKTTGVDGFDVIKTSDSVKLLTPPPPPKPPVQSEGAGKIDFKPKDGLASLID